MPPPTDSKPQTPPSKLRRFFRSTAAPLVIFCIVSLILKENYPISDYPMYSGISAASYYFYLADGEGEPIPTRENFGKSASAVKKMHGAHLNKIAESKNTRAYKLGWEEQVEAGKSLLAQLRERGEKRGYWRRNRPETIRIIRVDISRDSTGIVKEKRLLIEEPSVL